ncbi:hypothetical protein QUF64_14250 [Anaerolineales bacterium HSG6]|nr:hypothetical protein [Anaerolineales bacterium HSG6]
MQRRKFLKSSFVLAGGLVSSHLIYQGALASVVTPNHTELIHIVSARTNGRGLQVLDHLGHFAGNIGANVAANSVSEWSETLSDSDKETVQNTVDQMKQGGFTDMSKGMVYVIDDVHFYGFGHEDQLNACSAFHTRDKADVSAQLKTLMIEGPGILGLSLGARDWRSTNVSTANGLVPYNQLNTYAPSSFQGGMENPTIASTQVGSIGISYTADPQVEKGTLSVISTEDGGTGRLEMLLTKKYEVSYGTT